MSQRSRVLMGLIFVRVSVETLIHSDAARRWNTPALVDQLAHVGSEVDRAIRAHDAGNRNRFEGALGRALELFDLTAADNRWRGARRREILRARSEFCGLFFDDSVSPDSAAGLSRYFLHFAIAARRHAS